MEQLGDVQRQCLQEAFEFFDEDKDGRIGIKEFKRVLTKLDHDVSEDQLKGWLEQISAGESEDIDLDQFLSLMSDKQLVRQTSVFSSGF